MAQAKVTNKGNFNVHSSVGGVRFILLPGKDVTFLDDADMNAKGAMTGRQKADAFVLDCTAVAVNKPTLEVT